MHRNNGPAHGSRRLAPCDKNRHTGRRAPTRQRDNDLPDPGPHHPRGSNPGTRRSSRPTPGKDHRPPAAGGPPCSSTSHPAQCCCALCVPHAPIIGPAPHSTEPRPHTRLRCERRTECPSPPLTAPTRAQHPERAGDRSTGRCGPLRDGPDDVTGSPSGGVFCLKEKEPSANFHERNDRAPRIGPLLVAPNPQKVTSKITKANN